MRIVTLENSGKFYTSQVYLVLGNASRLEDVNTLVDTGQDPAILASVARAPTGVGKWPVEQVVLTHNHSDHCALLPRVREAFHPKVFAFSPNTDGVDSLLRDGESSVVRRLGRVGAAWRCAWPGIEATAPLRLDATSRFDMTRADRLSGYDESQGHRRPLNFGRISVTRICPIAQAGHSVRDLPVSAS